MGIELIISVPNPTAVVAVHIKHGRASHRTLFFKADSLSFVSAWN
jgi:hypothetical protein